MVKFKNPIFIGHINTMKFWKAYNWRWWSARCDKEIESLLIWQRFAFLHHNTETTDTPKLLMLSKLMH